MKNIKSKRLIKRDIKIGDNVQFYKHPYDKSIYEVKEILPDGTLFLDNGITAHTNIKSSAVKLII